MEKTTTLKLNQQQQEENNNTRSDIASHRFRGNVTLEKVSTRAPKAPRCAVY
jgi:hypothetical protein